MLLFKVRLIKMHPGKNGEFDRGVGEGYHTSCLTLHRVL